MTLCTPQAGQLQHEFCFHKQQKRLVLSVTTHAWSSKIRMDMAKHAGQEYARHCVKWHASAVAQQTDMADFTSHEVRLVFRFHSSRYLAALEFSSSEKCTFIELFRKEAQRTLAGIDMPTAWMDGVFVGMD